MYVAKKPCMFAGIKYYIGDTLPEGAVDPHRSAALVKQGVITEVAETNTSEHTEVAETNTSEQSVHILCHSADGDIDCEVTGSELVQIFEVLQADVSSVETLIQEITSNDVLVILDNVDSRKTVTKMVRQRAAVLFPEG